MRLLAVVVSLLSFGFASGARTGTVRTLAGTLFTGQIAITPDRVVVVNAQENLIVGLHITNIARITFNSGEREQPGEVRREIPPDGWKEMDLGAQSVRG